MKYSLYRELVDLVEEFETASQGDDLTLVRFTAWLNQKFAAQAPANQPVFRVEGEISMLVGYLYKYAKSYMKRSLEGLPFQTYDEFGYVATLVQVGSMTKTELIRANLMEKTTGTEIIKRLLNGGLIAQRDDENDRRSKRLEATETGRNAFIQAVEQLQTVSVLIAGNLEQEEKMQLFHLLQKLHLFHEPLFVEERETDLEELVERKIRNKKLM